MATTRKKKDKPADDRDRPLMDASGGTAGTAPKTFMHDQADLDRTDAKTAKLDKALAKAKEDADAIVKAIAHGKATESDDMKMSCLDEIGTLGNRIRDAVRKAVREVKAGPQPNVQK